MPTFTRENVRLHYELDGEGSPAVYISGFGSHSSDLLAIFLRRALAEAGYRLLAADNRGSGQTVSPQGHGATIADMADDIAALMDAEGMTSADILGISMGGAIAMMLALRHPHKVKRQIIAVSLAHGQNGRAEFMLRTARQMRDLGLPQELINRHNAIFLLGEDLFKLDWLMQAWVSAPADPFVQTAAGFDLQLDAMDAYDIRDQLAQITVPTLVISSPDDLLVPPHLQDELAAAIPGAILQHSPGGHVFMVLPQYRDSFVADVVAFWRSAG